MDATPVWYVGYGSNLSSARFDCYLRGGTPTGGVRDYPGCRDATPPARTAPLFVDGAVYFARHSYTWSGGMAFLDPDATGTAPARGYLITAGQLADVCAQEMRAEPGSLALPIDLITSSGRHSIGGGHYETLQCLGVRDGVPMITFTAPRRLSPQTTPSRAYLDMIASGLVETHGWTHAAAHAHLTSLIADPARHGGEPPSGL